jgi:hypothetical protein
VGYRRNRKVYRLTFEDHEGLEVMVRSVSVGKLMGVLQLADAMTAKPSQDQIDELFGWFAARIISWNYEDEAGEPLPPTLETLLDDDFDFVLRMVMAWVRAVSRVDFPLAPASANGTRADPVEASIPMSSPAGTS